MSESYALKIDIFPHILPVKYREALYKSAGKNFYNQQAIDFQPTLWDLERRFRIMDKYEGYVQVLNLAAPPIEAVVNPEKPSS